MRIALQRSERSDKFLEFAESLEANFIARLAMKRKLNRAVDHLPRKRLALEAVHEVFFWYRASISIRKARGNGVAFEFAHGRQQAALNGKWFWQLLERANLLVMRQAGIRSFDCGLNARFGEPVSAGCRHQRCKKAALIADENHLLRFGHELRKLFLDRLRRDVVAGI